MKRVLVLVFVLAAIGLALLYQDAYANPVDQLFNRFENQQQAINNGVARGQLTRQEADMVQDNLDWIKATFQRMKRDGLLTPQEIGRLNAMLDDNGRMINRERKDFHSVYQPGIAKRIEGQQQRINDGVRKGQLTRREADALQDNLDWIRENFQRMKRDGRITWREADRLDEMLDRNNRLINHERTDVDYDTRFRLKFNFNF